MGSREQQLAPRVQTLGGSDSLDPTHLPYESTLERRIALASSGLDSLVRHDNHKVALATTEIRGVIGKHDDRDGSHPNPKDSSLPKLGDENHRDSASDDQRSPEVREAVRVVLDQLRSEHTVELAKEAYGSTVPALTVFENCTGGGLDSIAAALYLPICLFCAGLSCWGDSAAVAAPVDQTALTSPPSRWRLLLLLSV